MLFPNQGLKMYYFIFYINNLDFISLVKKKNHKMFKKSTNIEIQKKIRNTTVTKRKKTNFNFKTLKQENRDKIIDRLA